MTDDNESYLRDLESAAAAVGNLPNDYQDLRTLLAALPAATAPDVRSAGSGQAGQATGTGGLDASGLTIQSSVPIGTESGVGQGIVQQQTIGIRNFFEDTRLLSVANFGPSLNDGLSHQVAKDWTAIAALGATGASAEITHNIGIDPSFNPLSTATMALHLFGWTAAGNATIKTKAFMPNPVFDPTLLPYVVFSVTIYKDTEPNQLFTNVSVANVILKIRDGADATDLAVSTPLDFLNMDLGSYRRMWVAVPSSQWLAGDLYAQVELDCTTTGSGGGVGSADFNAEVGNPQWELAPYQVPTLFLPEPNGAASVVYGAPGDGVDALTLYRSDDFAPRLNIDLSPADEGRITWGPGAFGAQDVRLRRVATKTLQLDASAGAANEWLAGDLVQILNNSLAITYVAGVVTQVVRSGAQGAATTVINYIAGKISSIVVTRGGKVVTLIPTYTGSDITAIARSVA